MVVDAFPPSWIGSKPGADGVGGGAKILPAPPAGGTGVDPREEQGAAKAADPERPVDLEDIPNAPALLLVELAPPRTLLLLVVLLEEDLP